MNVQRLAEYAGYRTRELVIEGTGPTIVLLHGLSHFCTCWNGVIAQLRRSGLQIVAPDLPGFGQAAPLEPGPPLQQLDDFVAAVVTRHAGNGPVIVVGNSLGGLLAVRAAETQRGLPVQGIIGLAAAGMGWAPALQLLSAGNLAILRALSHLSFLPPLPRALAERFGRGVLYGDTSAANPAFVRDFTAALHSREGTHRLITSALRIGAAVENRVPFTAINCPTVIVQGTRDRLISVAASRRLHAEIPDSEYVLLPGVGHCPQIEVPDKIAELIIEFALKSTTPGAVSANLRARRR